MTKTETKTAKPKSKYTTGYVDNFVGRMEREYGITAVEGKTAGAIYAFDAEREKLCILLPRSLVKTLGSGKCSRTPALYMDAEEAAAFAQEILAVYQEWFIEIPQYNRVPTEEILGIRKEGRKRCRKRRQEGTPPK